MDLQKDIKKLVHMDLIKTDHARDEIYTESINIWKCFD